MSAVALRPYQLDAVASIERELDVVRSTLYLAATGSGKTTTGSEVARRFVEDYGVNVLVMMHRKELVDQFAARLELFGLNPAIEQGPRKASLLDKVVVASVQTLRDKRLAKFPRNHFGLIIVDEAHHMVAIGYQAIINYFHTAKVLAVTATADRADGVPLGSVVNTVADTYPIEEAVQAGFLVPARGVRVEVDGLDLSQVRQKVIPSGGAVVDISTGTVREVPVGQVAELHPTDLGKAATDPAAVEGVVVPLLELAEHRRTIVFAVSVEHAQAITKSINVKRPDAARCVFGAMHKTDRARNLADFERGSYQFLVNCMILTEGYDCLDAETEILTDNGWRGIGQFKEGDLVYSINRETEKLELVPVERYVEREMRSGEKMFTINSQHANIRTSEGHQFHVKYRDPSTGQPSKNWLTLDGDELTERRSPYVLPISAEPTNPPPGIPLTPDELKFIAWFMTDGCLEGHSVVIYQSKGHKDEIRELLKRLGLDFTERVRENLKGYAEGHALPLHCFQIPKGTHKGALKRNGWSKYAEYLDKTVAPALHKMSIAQFELFWSELLKGDGSTQDGKSGWLWCADHVQTDAYMRMAVERGKSVSAKAITTKKGKTVYRVSVRDARWLSSCPADKRAAKMTLEPPHPGEKVWCVTNRNSTIVTRRHGKVVIIGNCPPIECVAMARPTQSRILWVQVAGRGLRPCPEIGKTECLVLDFVGVSCQFDLVGPADVLGGALVGPVETYVPPEKKKEPKVKLENPTPAVAEPEEDPVALVRSPPKVEVSFSTRVVDLMRRAGDSVASAGRAVRGVGVKVGGWFARIFGGGGK